MHSAFLDVAVGSEEPLILKVPLDRSQIDTGAREQAFGLRLSAHCAPSLHIHPACALPSLAHIEYFHDHARIEAMFFDGFREPVAGALAPDRSRPGLGLELRAADAEKFSIS
jgi:hypothetical protein